LNLECRGPTVFNVTVPGTLPEGSLDSQGNIVTGYNISSKYTIVLYFPIELLITWLSEALFMLELWFRRSHIKAHKTLVSTSPLEMHS
jgi:hypothetical protein